MKKCGASYGFGVPLDWILYIIFLYNISATILLCHSVNYVLCYIQQKCVTVRTNTHTHTQYNRQAKLNAAVIQQQPKNEEREKRNIFFPIQEIQISIRDLMSLKLSLWVFSNKATFWIYWDEWTCFLFDLCFCIFFLFLFFRIFIWWFTNINKIDPK